MTLANCLSDVCEYLEERLAKHRIRNLQTEILKELILCITDSVNNVYKHFFNRLSHSILDEILGGLQRLCRRGRCLVVDVEARLVYRGGFGRGAAQPWGWFGVYLHPVYLVPVLPGSSIKGALRSFYARLLEERSCSQRCVEACISAVFGDAEDSPIAGVSPLIVTDGYPVKAGPEGILVGDVLTPHYQSGGETVRGEEEARPKPIQGFSIGTGTLFRFLLFLDEEHLWENLESLRGIASSACISSVVGSPDPLRLLLYLLVGALEKEGLGGKTSRGYGLMRITSLQAYRVHR